MNDSNFEEPPDYNADGLHNLTDEDLTRLADELFQKLDAEELEAESNKLTGTNSDSNRIDAYE
jgi:hypothetical protein